MSILNGMVNSSYIKADKMPFGEKLCKVSSTAEPAMDCVLLRDNILVSGGNGKLTLYEITSEGKAVELSQLSGIGNTRQIAVWDSFAYVSTRADGVFVCDLRDVANPKLAYHIDTQELATGIDAANGVMAVTNRHMGCELYDVSNPYQPKRIGDFLCGEAQSVYLYRNLAAVGDWMNHQIRLYSIDGADGAKELSRFSIDGFADGVCIFERDGRVLCLAAGGHHSARLKNRCKYDKYPYVTAQMLADGFGGGHEVELFDITEPTDPEFLSQVKAPPLFATPDTWRVFTDGKTCVFTDTVNGMFIVDFENLLEPYIKAYYRLPIMPPREFLPTTVQMNSGAATGAASVNGYLCIASPDSGVHILDVGVGTFLRSSCDGVNWQKSSVNAEVVFNPDGQLHSFCERDGYLYCACGETGIVRFDLDTKQSVTYATKGICHDLCFVNDYMITAEGLQGAACYKLTENGPVETSRVTFGRGRSVREAVALQNAVALEMGSMWATNANLTSDGILQPCENVCQIILLYHRHLSKTLAGEYLPAFAIAHGPMLLNCKDELEISGIEFGDSSCPFEEGVCGYGDKMISILRGRYLMLDNPADIANVDIEKDGVKVENAKLRGIPFVCGNDLVVMERCSGKIEVLDISNPKAPVLRKTLDTGSHPEFAEKVGDKILVACGHDGIIAID